MRELAGVVPRAPEAVQPLECRNVAGRKTAHRGNQVPRRHRLPVARLAVAPPAVTKVHPPQPAVLVEFSARHAGVELHVPLQVMPAGHMLQIPQNLWLLGIALRPLPFLQQLLVPGETINIGIRVATSARIPVPVPGAADGAARLKHPHLQAQLVAQRLQHVDAGKPRTHHHGVKIRLCARHLVPPLPVFFALYDERSRPYRRRCRPTSPGLWLDHDARVLYLRAESQEEPHDA